MAGLAPCGKAEPPRMPRRARRQCSRGCGCTDVGHYAAYYPGARRRPPRRRFPPARHRQGLGLEGVGARLLHVRSVSWGTSRPPPPHRAGRRQNRRHPGRPVWELQHIILSHHGQLEYGSPKRPKTLEAQLLHFIDNIDATTNTFVSVLESPGWSPFQRNYGRPLLEPSEMRARWTTPPPGEVGERGPGAPSGRAPSRARGPRMGDLTAAPSLTLKHI